MSRKYPRHALAVSTLPLLRENGCLLSVCNLDDTLIMQGDTFIAYSLISTENVTIQWKTIFNLPKSALCMNTDDPPHITGHLRAVLKTKIERISNTNFFE